MKRWNKVSGVCVSLCVRVFVCPGVSGVVPVSQELNRRRVLMASQRGTSAAIRPGDALRIGKSTAELVLLAVMFEVTQHIHFHFASMETDPLRADDGQMVGGWGGRW